MGEPDGTKAMQERGARMILLALIALVSCLAVLRWQPGEGLRIGLPGAASGDEPHYLVIVHSVLFDRDLELANNYANARAGGPEAGERFRGLPLDPHVMLVDRAGRTSLIWFDYYDCSKPLSAPSDAHGFLFALRRPNPLQPGSYIQVPSHPPGFGFLLAACVAPFRPAPAEVERLASIMCLLCALAALPLAYRTGRAAGLPPWPALGAVALFAVCSTWLPYSHSLFSEPAVTTLLLLALHEHLRGRSVTAAIAAASVLWLKPYFALVPACWMLERWLAGQRMDALKLAALVGLASVALLIFNQSYAAALLVGGNAGLVLDAEMLPRLRDHLFEPTYGLLVFAPWAAVSMACLIRAARRDEASALRAIGWPVLAQYALFVVLPIGSNGALGPRYWVPFLPWLAILAVQATLRNRRCLAGPLVVLGLISAAMAVPDSLLYQTTRAWLEPAFTSLRLLIGG